MPAHPAALSLQKKAERRAPATLSLVPPGAVSVQVSEDANSLLDFNDDDVIADIVPVPPSIPVAMRVALERMISLRFPASDSDSDRLDEWLHAGHPSLRGASPFETLVAGDGVGVLRALLWNGQRKRGRRARGASVERRQTMLRLER